VVKAEPPNSYGRQVKRLLLGCFFDFYFVETMFIFIEEKQCHLIRTCNLPRKNIGA